MAGLAGPWGRGTLEELIFCVNEEVYLFETTRSKNFVGSESLLPDILSMDASTANGRRHKGIRVTIPTTPCAN